MGGLYRPQGADHASRVWPRFRFGYHPPSGGLGETTPYFPDGMRRPTEVSPMAKKSDELLARARQSAKTARAGAKAAQQSLVRRSTTYATAYAVGKGALDWVPTFDGKLPRTVTLGILGLGGAWMMGGKGAGAQVLEGMGDAGLTVASYQLGKGEEVYGGRGAGQSASRERAALDRLEDDLDALDVGWDDDDDDDYVGDDDDYYEDDYVGESDEDVIDVDWSDVAA